MAVQKSTVAWYSRSVPGCGPRGLTGCCCPVKMPEKMSLKLPQVDDPGPDCGVPPLKPEKSNPSKSTGPRPPPDCDCRA